MKQLPLRDPHERHGHPDLLLLPIVLRQNAVTLGFVQGRVQPQPSLQMREGALQTAVETSKKTVARCYKRRKKSFQKRTQKTK